MSTYPSQAWQENGMAYCGEKKPFPRVNEGGFYQEELDYDRDGGVNGGPGGIKAQFVAGRYGKELYLDFCYVYCLYCC